MAIYIFNISKFMEELRGLLSQDTIDISRVIRCLHMIEHEIRPGDADSKQRVASSLFALASRRPDKIDEDTWDKVKFFIYTFNLALYPPRDDHPPSIPLLSLETRSGPLFFITTLLLRYRKHNSGEENIFTFFDDRAIPSLICDAYTDMDPMINDFLGPKRDFGRPPEEIEAERLEAERILREKQEAEEAQRKKELAAFADVRLSCSERTYFKAYLLKDRCIGKAVRIYDFYSLRIIAVYKTVDIKEIRIFKK